MRVLLPSEFELDGMAGYLLEDGLEVVDEVAGREAFGLTGGAIDLLQLAEDAPLALLLESACLRVVMGAENAGEDGRMEDCLKSGVEEAGIAEVVETASDGQLAHVETIL